MNRRPTIILWVVRVAAVFILASGLRASYLQATHLTRHIGFGEQVYPGHMGIALSMLQGRPFDLAGYSDLRTLVQPQMRPAQYTELREKLATIQIDRSKEYLIPGEFGTVFYYYVAFRLFGINANAVETTWVAIVAFSALLYFVAFFNDRSALTLLAVVGAGFLIFNEYESARIYGYYITRLSPLLAMTAFLHFFWSLQTPGKMTKWSVVLLVLQGIVLVFWILHRTNSLLYLAMIVLTFAVLGVARWKKGEWRSWFAAKLPVAAIPLGMYLIVKLVVIPAMAHPDYRTYPFHHLLWHPIVVGMACEGKDPCLAITLSDGSGLEIARNSRFNRWGPSLYYGPNYEWVLRQEFMQCVQQSPRYYASLYYHRAVYAISKIIIPDLRDDVSTRAGTLGLIGVIVMFAAFYRGPIGFLLGGLGTVATTTFLASLIYCPHREFLAPAAFCILFLGLTAAGCGASAIVRGLSRYGKHPPSEGLR